MSKLSTINIHIQRQLFPALEEEIGTLSSKEQLFVRVLELIDLAPLIKTMGWCGVGRKPHSRRAMAKAFIAKAVWNLPTTKALVEMLKLSPNLRCLCGWESFLEVPPECTFSRAFAGFAEIDLSAKLHEQLIKEHLCDHLCGHISRDATAIKAREKPLKKSPKKKKKKKRGRPRKGEVRKKEPRRIEQQVHRSLQENLAELPIACDVGTKKNAKGYKESWVGYKLHLDVVDGDIPVSAILTSASMHDSQASIPLAQMSAARVTNLYDLMDAAYDCKEIHEVSARLGHVAIIDHNPRRGQAKHQMEPATAQRYKQRSSAERSNSDLKDNHGGNHVRVRGAKKVFCHLMFGLLVISAKQLFNLLL